MIKIERNGVTIEIIPPDKIMIDDSYQGIFYFNKHFLKRFERFLSGLPESED